MPPRTSFDLTKHGILIIALGTLVCALGSLMARPVHEQLGYVLAAAATAACLLIAFVSFGIRQARPVPQRLIRAYFAAGIASIVCCMAFWLIQPGNIEVRAVGILAGLLGLFWGSCYMRLAFYFQPRSFQARTLSILAAMTSCFGIIVATRTGLSKLGAVTTVGCYMIMLGVQIYLTAAFLHREAARASS
jgi:hypothetical protein